MTSQPAQVGLYFINMRLLVQSHLFVLQVLIIKEGISQGEDFDQA